MAEAYKKAGVNIDAGNEAVDRIKQYAQKTFRNEVKTELGGFGSLFALQGKYNKPILVSGTDGVGTKLKIAFDTDRHDTVGIDLVAMCVNDILVQGAEPLFFLDYIATGKLFPDKVEEIVKGISEGCIQSNCSLIGGETAEMPDMYGNGEYDLAGFAVGVVDEDKLINGSKISDGDMIIGLASTGVHSNGYSLVRHLLFKENQYQVTDYVEEIGGTIGDILLTPTKIYVKPVLNVLEKITVKGMAHITGGGILENIPRILPEGLQAEINIKSWDVPPIFSFLQGLGDLDDTELYRTFNMGIGFILVVDKDDVDLTMEVLKEHGESAKVIGQINQGDLGVKLLGDRL